MAPEFRLNKQKVLQGLGMTAAAIAISAVNWDEVKELGFFEGIKGRYMRGRDFAENLRAALEDAHGLRRLRMQFPADDRHQNRYFKRLVYGSVRYSNLQSDLRAGESRVVEANTRFPNLYVQQLYFSDEKTIPFKGVVGVEERRIDPVEYSKRGIV